MSDNKKFGQNRIVRRRPIDGFVTSYTSAPSTARYNANNANAPRTQAQSPVAVQPAATINTSQVSSDQNLSTPSRKPTTGPLDMSLPGGDSAIRRQFKRIDSVWKNIRKWSFRATAATLVLIVSFGGFSFSQGYLKLHQVFQGGQSAVALQTNVNPDLLKGEGDGRINILLFGKGGPGHDGPDLTDTMLVFSIDPVNHTAALLSVPRDLWVNVSGYGDMKINAAYPNAKYHITDSDPSASQRADHTGITVAEQTVEQVLGIPIDYYAMVDFSGFQQAIDTVNGINVNVPEQLYDPTMAWQNNWNPILAHKGAQKMNGNKALLYARSRETSSDFARTQRQRQIIVALEKKVFSIGTFSDPLKLAKLADEFGSHAETDMSIHDATRLYQILKGIDTSRTGSIGLTDPGHDLLTTDAVGNQSVDRPIAGFFRYSAIHNYVRNALKDGYIAKENAGIEVVNGTTKAGVATAEAKVLRSYGYRIAKVIDIPKKSPLKATQLIDLTKGSKKYTSHYLENRFHVATTKTLPPGIRAHTATFKADFVIILGE